MEDWESFKSNEDKRAKSHDLVAKFLRFENKLSLYNELRKYIDTAHRDLYIKGIRSPEVADTVDSMYQLLINSTKQDLKVYSRMHLTQFAKLALSKSYK